MALWKVTGAKDPSGRAQDGGQDRYGRDNASCGQAPFALHSNRQTPQTARLYICPSNRAQREKSSVIQQCLVIQFKCNEGAFFVHFNSVFSVISCWSSALSRLRQTALERS